MPAIPTDSRSLCPAINALANHGYIPRNGRNISVNTLKQVLKITYHLEDPVISNMFGFLPQKQQEISLDQVTSNKAITGILFHEDIAIRHTSESLVKILTDKGQNGEVELHDLVNYAFERWYSVASDQMHPQIQTEWMAQSMKELCLLYAFLSTNEKMSVVHLTEFLGMERIPSIFLQNLAIHKDDENENESKAKIDEKDQQTEETFFNVDPDEEFGINLQTAPIKNIVLDDLFVISRMTGCVRDPRSRNLAAELAAVQIVGDENVQPTRMQDACCIGTGWRIQGAFLSCVAGMFCCYSR